MSGVVRITDDWLFPGIAVYAADDDAMQWRLVCRGMRSTVDRVHVYRDRRYCITSAAVEKIKNGACPGYYVAGAERIAIAHVKTHSSIMFDILVGSALETLHITLGKKAYFGISNKNLTRVSAVSPAGDAVDVHLANPSSRANRSVRIRIYRVALYFYARAASRVTVDAAFITNFNSVERVEHMHVRRGTPRVVRETAAVILPPRVDTLFVDSNRPIRVGGVGQISEIGHLAISAHFLLRYVMSERVRVTRLTVFYYRGHSFDWQTIDVSRFPDVIAIDAPHEIIINGASSRCRVNRMTEDAAYELRKRLMINNDD